MARPGDSATQVNRLIEEAIADLAALILDAIGGVLDSLRDAIMTGNGPPDLGLWSAETSGWNEWLNDVLVPAVRTIIDRIFALGPEVGQAAATQHAQTYTPDVVDRLTDWPVQAYDEIRSEIEHGIMRGDTTARLRDRVARLLNLDAVTRDVEDKAERLYDQIDAGVDPATERQLRARIRDLYRTATEDRRRWEWRATRIARTEATGAVNSATDAWAVATGRQWLREWASRRDTRVRPTHRAADGQQQPIGQLFAIGNSMLLYPGWPAGPADETINCRCGLLLIPVT